MEGQGLLVELGAFDRAGGSLDAEADEVGGGDGRAQMAQGLLSMSASSSGIGALPFQRRCKVSGTSGRSTWRRHSVWQALSDNMKGGVSGSTRISRRIAPHSTSCPQKRQVTPVLKFGSRARGMGL